MSVRLAACLSPLLVAGGCITGSFERDEQEDPIVAATLAALQPGTDTLGTCLQRLGAPSRVFEYRVEPDGSSGMLLLWSWRDDVAWGIEAAGGTDDASASVSFDQGAADITGCALWFSRDLRLEAWRRGRIGELLAVRRRPSVPEQP
jgi:hypothetical protein